MSSVEERSLERVNFPYFDEDAYEKFFNWADRNVFDVEGLCLKIKSRESMVDQLQSNGFVVVETTDEFQDRLTSIGYDQDIASEVYDISRVMHSQPDRKRRWVRADGLQSATRRPLRVFRSLCALWQEAFQELAQVLDRSLTLRNVLGLLSGGDSRAHQTSHFDCNPGASADPACVGHITALGYMEDFSLDIWPGSHRVSHEYCQGKGNRTPPSPIAVSTVQMSQHQILALSSHALHRGVPNLELTVKTRISALLVREGEGETAGEIHYCLGDKTRADEEFMRDTFLGCFNN